MRCIFIYKTIVIGYYSKSSTMAKKGVDIKAKQETYLKITEKIYWLNESW